MEPHSAIPAAPSPIGDVVPRLDARAKVTGTARYTIDFSAPNMCHARLLRSPHPHALIRSIDVEAARRVPGVVAVVTAADLPDVHLLYGHAVRDHPLIAVGKVRYAGEPVVGVVAEDLLTAEEALEKIEVDYEPLPWVTDPVAALGDDAPLVHDAAAERGVYSGVAEATTAPRPNLCMRVEHAWGDIDAAFAGAALVIDGTYDYPSVYAYTMEPNVVLATFDHQGLTVVTSAQHPFLIQAELAHCFNLPLAQVRVSIPYVGGAYGAKGYSKIEPLAAALALRARRPVRLALSVTESILTARSISARIELQTAFNADGTIRGRRSSMVLDCGAYAENTPRLAARAASRVAGPYRIPALSVEALSVYTNGSPGGSYRGLGAPQAVFAGESQMDEAAQRLGLDPLELRRRNLLRRGERPWPGARGMDADLLDDLRIAEAAVEWHAEAEPGRGRGLAFGASDAGAEPTTTSLIRVLADGSVALASGSSELGQGATTVLAQIAAAELGVELDAVRLTSSDTSLVSYDRSTGASRTTVTQGLAIQRAAADARHQMIAWARELHPGAEVSEERGGALVDGELLAWSKILEAWFGGGSGEVVGRGYVRREGLTLELPLFWEVAVTGLDVSVDAETGEISVNRLVTLSDIGRAINPQLAEGQDIGAAMMGLGVALREALVSEDGRLANGSLFEYRFPRTTDLPDRRSILAERADGVGPYGAKGAGEGSLNPVAPALANAVYRATGVRIREVPLTPERVWRALRDALAAEHLPTVPAAQPTSLPERDMFETSTPTTLAPEDAGMPEAHR